MNLVEPIFWHARMQPRAAAIIEHEQTITYGELADRVLRTASHLSKLGIARGDQVGLCLKNDSQHIVALLAVAWLGAVAAPIDWQSRPAEKTRIVDALQLRLALVTPESDTGLDCPKVALDVAWHSAVAAADRSPNAVQDWHAPIAVLGSSGSTGLPKFTIATHLEYYFHLAKHLEVVPPGRHRYLAILPLYFAWSRIGCLSHLFRGDTLIFYPPVASPEEIVENMIRHKVTLAQLAPSMLRQLLLIADDHSHLLPNVQVHIGGAPFFADEKRKVIDKVTPRFCEEYGAAAIGPIAAIQAEDMRERPTSVGRAFSLVNIEIVDDNDRPLGAGVTGQLRCRGPGLTTPLPNSPAVTSADFRDGWYYPGELGMMDELGYVFLQGRTSEVIFRGGAKIFPGEVETVLQAHGSVAESAVVGRTLLNNEQELVAYVVTKHPLTSAELFAHCLTRLTPFKVPREIHVVAELPRNSSGKVDRAALANLKPACPN